MKKLILLIACSFSLNFALSQAYTTAAGARFGKGIGITVSQVFAPGWTAEGILSHRKGENLTHYAILAEHHRKLLGRRLNFFLGAGIQGGYYDHLEEGNDLDPFGLAAVVGLDFTIKRLNLSFDFQPNYNLNGGHRDFSSDSALSLRYVIIKRIKSKKKKGKLWTVFERKKNKKKAKK